LTTAEGLNALKKQLAGSETVPLAGIAFSAIPPPAITLALALES